MEIILNTINIILSFSILIGLIVGIHELGHFLAARYFGICVLKFKIGFGKTLLKWTDKRKTDYELGLLPLGGYVQMLGESAGIEENISSSELKVSKPISYKDVSLGARAVVTAAGPFANFILAIVAYFLISIIGAKELAPLVGQIEIGSLASQSSLTSGDRIISINEREIISFNDINTFLASKMGESGDITISFLREGSDVSATTVVSLYEWQTEGQRSPVSQFGIVPLIPALVASVQEGSPAKKAGILSGDIIKKVNNYKITTWFDLSEAISNEYEQELNILVDRGGIRIPFRLTPNKVVNEAGEAKGVIGVQRLSSLDDLPKEFIVINKENFFGAILKGFTETYKFTILILDSIKKMITGSVSAENIGGPIQISMLAGSAAKAGFVSFLTIIAVLSINLGLLNLLPIPVLDGGQLVMIAIEKIKGSPVSESFLEYSFRLGILLIGSLMIFAVFNDIARVI